MVVDVELALSPPLVMVVDVELALPPPPPPPPQLEIKIRENQKTSFEVTDIFIKG